MKVAVLGANGMAGHVVARWLEESGHEVWRHMGSSDADFYKNPDQLEPLLKRVGADVVVNCIGVLVAAAAENPERASVLNSALPLALSKFSPRLLHLSTDCVFSGDRGSYVETDTPDAKYIYGVSKRMGEVDNERDCTVRVSIIGPELREGTGLLEWVRRQTGFVNGYANAFWNGITTLELAKFIQRFVEDEKDDVHGIVHLRCERAVSKLELVRTISEVYGLDLKVQPYALEKKVDKSLLSTRDDISYTPVPIKKQLEELKEWY
jgi:dTDP-4-dehydrorhamnose reductase